MIEETQMQSMEVLSRLISSVYRTKGGFQFRKFIFWEKRFPYLSLFLVVFSLQYNILFKEKTWQSLRIHFEEFSNSFYFSSKIKYCKREKNMCILCVWLV